MYRHCKDNASMPPDGIAFWSWRSQVQSTSAIEQGVRKPTKERPLPLIYKIIAFAVRRVALLMFLVQTSPNSWQSGKALEEAFPILFTHHPSGEDIEQTHEMPFAKGVEWNNIPKPELIVWRLFPYESLRSCFSVVVWNVSLFYVPFVLSSLALIALYCAEHLFF